MKFLLVQQDVFVLVCVSRSVVSNALQPHGLHPPGSSVHGIFQARVLEWGAIAFSRPAYRFLKRQVRWSGIPISFRIFQSLL